MTATKARSGHSGISAIIYPGADISDVHLLEPKLSKHLTLISHLLEMHS